MKKSFLFIVLSIYLMVISNIKAEPISYCSIDSIFNYHISSIESYIKRIIEGEILPTGDNRIVYASIDRKPVNTQYNSSSKFVIWGDNASFLRMYEILNEDIEFERHHYVPNIMVCYEEISEIRKWYDKNRNRINGEKVIRIIEWLNISNSKSEMDNIEEYNNLLKKLENSFRKMDTFISDV